MIEYASNWLFALIDQISCLNSLSLSLSLSIFISIVNLFLGNILVIIIKYVYLQAPLISPTNSTNEGNVCTVCDAKLDRKSTTYKHNDRFILKNYIS